MKQLIMGNEAIARGALRAGLGFFAAYPITPASEIMHFLAEKEGEIEFVHAEDEIAAIHMAIGASLAGLKAMTSTSGPGMSLKQEGIGLAHMMEIPLVVVDVQRVGPSTGMPTLPSQGDLIQARHGSHGDYNPLVFYPATVEECYFYTIEAFNAAEESRSPVILLLDGFLAHLSETVDLRAVKPHLKRRKLKSLGGGNRHFTGLLAREGIPLTDDSDYYRQWYTRVKNKIMTVVRQYNYFEFLDNPQADTLLIAFGITARVIRPLKKAYGLFRPIRLFPVLEKELSQAAANYDRIVVVEMNDGQYAGEVQRVLRREVISLPILGGKIHLREIQEALNAL